MSNAGTCNQDIYENGKYAGMIAGGDADVIESYVKFIAEKTGEPVDWHYCGGRARILTTGDVQTVRSALNDYLLQIYIE